MARMMIAIAVALTGVLTAPLPAVAQVFSAKTVTLVVGYPPGGGYDAIARVFVRYYGRHLPGTPAAVVQNQPGAGSMLAANSLYNLAPKDGSQIGMFAAAVAIEPLIGNSSAKYDITRFQWVGNLDRDTYSCGAWHTTGVQTWQDVRTKKLKLAATGIGAIQQARFLTSALGIPADVMYGFPGMGHVHLALQRGEADAACGIFASTARQLFQEDTTSGRFRFFVQFGQQPEPHFGAAPTIYSVVEKAEDQQLAQLVFAPAEITRPIAAPPGTPPGILQALRAGFERTVRDPEYLAEVRKMQLDPKPMSGEETAATFARLVDAPREVVERAKGIVSPVK
jgi:tripartite-type tricarboxylate transporter receptor subunit TctC